MTARAPRIVRQTLSKFHQRAETFLTRLSHSRSVCESADSIRTEKVHPGVDTGGHTALKFEVPSGHVLLDRGTNEGLPPRSPPTIPHKLGKGRCQVIGPECSPGRTRLTSPAVAPAMTVATAMDRLDTVRGTEEGLSLPSAPTIPHKLGKRTVSRPVGGVQVGTKP
jgi:hypothetical protein